MNVTKTSNSCLPPGHCMARTVQKVKSHMEDLKPKSLMRVSDGRLRLTKNDSKVLDVQESGGVTFDRNMTSSIA